MGNRRAWSTIIVLVIVLVVFVIILYMREGSPVGVRDAYCDNMGHFNFTLENSDEGTTSFTYRWTLNDPKADEPVLWGEGNDTLRPGESRRYTVPINDTDYDARFYVMYIRVFVDGKEVLEYREQKSPYDWDYSTLPPTFRG